MIYKMTKYEAQEFLVKARVASCQIKYYVIDAAGVYNADWTTRGVDVKAEVTQDETEYFKLNWLPKPHLTMYVNLSIRFGQYLIIGVWGSEETLERLKDKWLKKEKTNGSKDEGQRTATEIPDGGATGHVAGETSLRPD